MFKFGGKVKTFALVSIRTSDLINIGALSLHAARRAFDKLSALQLLDKILLSRLAQNLEDMVHAELNSKIL